MKKILIIRCHQILQLHDFTNNDKLFVCTQQVFKKGNPSTDIAFVEKTIGSFFCAYELDLFPLINCCNISLVYFKRFDMSVRFERVMSYSECVERFPSLSTYVTSLACDARIISVSSKNATCTVRLLIRNKIAWRVFTHFLT